MRISKDSYRLLKKFLATDNNWQNVWQVQQSFGEDINFELLMYLNKEGYLDCLEPPSMEPPIDDYTPPALEFRVSDFGKAYMEHRKAAILDTLLTRGIAIAALIISLISLLR